MQRRVKELRGLVMDSNYTVDPDAVANAIIARALARQHVPGTRFRNEIRGADYEPAVIGAVGLRASEIRSFRPARAARSFRLTAPRRSRDANHRILADPRLAAPTPAGRA